MKSKKPTLNGYFCKSWIGKSIIVGRSIKPRIIAGITHQGDAYFRLDFVVGEPEFVNFFTTPVRLVD